MTAGSISIIHLCARTTISLARWMGTRQTTNEHINTLCAEIRALSATYDALNNKLRSPTVASAAESLQRISDGGIWQHIAMSIKDCEKTLVVLNQILNKYNADSTDLFQHTYRLFGQSMTNGDISRLRLRIPIFDMVLAFLLQLMIMWVMNSFICSLSLDRFHRLSIIYEEDTRSVSCSVSAGESWPKPSCSFSTQLSHCQVGPVIWLSFL